MGLMRHQTSLGTPIGKGDRKLYLVTARAPLTDLLDGVEICQPIALILVLHNKVCSNRILVQRLN